MTIATIKTEPATPVLRPGIAYMYEQHGKSPGHRCGDCQSLMRNARVSTICVCRKYPLRKGGSLLEYRSGNGWRGHWPACGAWKGIVKKPARIDRKSLQEILEFE